MIAPSLPSVPLADFPSNRWATLRGDLADFLGSPWPAESVQLGWTDLDLFAVDADRPYTRIDDLGLVPDARWLQNRRAQRRGRVPRNARRRAAELPPQARTGVGGPSGEVAFHAPS